MIDIKGTIQKARLERAKKFIAITDLLDFLKQMDITANFSDIVDFLLIKLKDNNPRTSTLYDSFGNAMYEEICLYTLPSNLEENELETWANFFEVLENVKCNFSKYDLEEWLLDDCDLVDTSKSKNFINKGDEDLVILRSQIENLLGIKIPIDNKITEKHKQERLFFLTGEITKLDPEYFSTPKKFDIDQQKEECKQLNQTTLTQKQHIAELEQQLEELKQKLAQATQPPTVEEKQNRISQPQRDIFTLLVMNNYQNYQSRNALFEAINADMKAKGIRASDIKYPTLDNLIDDNLRINKISPFPPKQK
ncbi:bZIP transcription factor [Glaesserella parasuis]|uniref:bZIP transcription factor n=3 Tax=Glaesserella parasuis TaxID=738 RepID=UPI0002CB3875|nr:bZIP transcription factor [Glaesserella parasuis]EMY45355.1 hypothetical protein OE7_10186 [Glaesserella parasuis gx033]MDG6248754.1 bZIP transcription factor [Glaesserella parasuis]MDG6263631.1 bZIP transcription factor [Glaesserella parasuis]MDG6284649.1 bZIP transcription factor [Glaesserella parasuis]MDG6286766.1 bZIP transcription factor [Glaesserella parasuis]